MSKARVSPLKKLSIPRLELQAAVMNARLSSTLVENSRFTFGQIHHLSDSGAVLSMIENGSSTMKEFCGTRVAEINSKQTRPTGPGSKVKIICQILEPGGLNLKTLVFIVNGRMGQSG